VDTHVTQIPAAFDTRARPERTAEAQAAPAGRRPPRPRRVRGRTMLVLAAFLGLAGLLAVLFGPDPQPVEIARATRGDMVVTVSSEGKTRVREEYEVTGPVGGRLLRVLLKAGDQVVANETVVATVEPPQPNFNDLRSQAELEAKVRAAESALAQAHAELERARAQLDFAELDVTRYRRLAAQGVTAQRAIEQYVLEAATRRAALQVAQRAVEQRTAELEQAHAALLGPGGRAPGQAAHPVQMRSPISGRVLNVIRESETVLTPGQPILVVGDVAQIEAMLEMLSEDAVKVREGMPALLEGWGGAPLNARVRRVEPFSYTKVSALGIEEQRVRVFLDITAPIEAWRAMGHGYRVTGRIVTWEGRGVLKLPMGALFRDGARWAVYTRDGGAARLRHVQLGRLNQAEAEVLHGVTEGTEVILHPSDRVADGVLIRPRG
jgi:HlyD family secretion protein